MNSTQEIQRTLDRDNLEAYLHSLGIEPQLVFMEPVLVDQFVSSMDPENKGNAEKAVDKYRKLCALNVE